MHSFCLYELLTNFSIMFPWVKTYNMYSKLNIRHNDEGLIFKSSPHVFQTTCRYQVAKILPNPRGRWSRVRKAPIFYTILMECVRWVEQSFRTWPNDCTISGWNLGCKEGSFLALSFLNMNG